MGKGDYARKELAEAIRKARGERSIRNYAAHANVNPTTISRIENGEYVPTNKIIERLTSKEAAPQNGITNDDLKQLVAMVKMENAGKEISSLAGGASLGMGLSSIFGSSAALVGSAAGYALSKLLLELDYADELPAPHGITQEKFDNYRKKLKRFQASSLSLIYESLAEQDIIFKPGKKDRAFSGPKPHAYISLLNCCIDEWWFQFEIKDDDYYVSTEMPAWARAHQYISRYIRYKSDPKRKISIVTNNKNLLDELLELKNQNSFRGNFSVIFIDDKNLKLVSETNISFYVEGGNPIIDVI